MQAHKQFEVTELNTNKIQVKKKNKSNQNSQLNDEHDLEEHISNQPITEIKKPIISPILRNKGSSTLLIINTTQNIQVTFRWFKGNKNIKLKCPLDLRALLIINRPFLNTKDYNFYRFSIHFAHPHFQISRIIIPNN